MIDFTEQINNRKKILEYVDQEMISKMHEISFELVTAIKRGNKVMSAGNGGSAANAQHITGDIVGRFKLERKAFAGLTLTVEPSVITAVGNDYNYEVVFSRQVEGLGKRGDILIVLSSSSNSPNLIKAVEKAREMGVKTVGLLGNNGGKLIEIVDMAITIPDTNSDICEEFAMTLSHIILLEVESELVRLTLQEGK